MELRFYYPSFVTRFPTHVSLALSVPKNIFETMLQFKHISATIHITPSREKTYIFDVADTVQYRTEDIPCQTVPVPVHGLNKLFILQWLVRQIGKPYDYVGRYTPIVTEGKFHPAKLVMCALSQVLSIDQPETYSVSQVLEWSTRMQYHEEMDCT